MGSGLILLVIVAAWLAVLVPMALRSHESADSVSSVDRFSDAMRVLSRRDAAARARAREVAGAARLGEPEDLHDLDDELDDDLDLDLDDWDDREPLTVRVRAVLVTTRTRASRLAGAVGAVQRSGGRRPLSAAARRRRLLVGLLSLSAVTLLAGLVVAPVLLAVHAVADVLLVLYVVALRRLVRARQQQRAASRPAPARRVVVATDVTVAAPGPAVEVDVAVVDAEPQPAEPAEPVVTVARHDEPLPVAAGLGAPWSPVPVPPPMYASKPVAPRSARTVDLTRPGAYTEAVAAGERLPGMEDEPPGTARPVEPRRAVNDW